MKRAAHRAEMAVKVSDEISKVALARFLELMADMGWDENYAVDELYTEIGQPLDHSKKMIRQWFERGIPPAQSSTFQRYLASMPDGWQGKPISIRPMRSAHPGSMPAR